PVLRPRPHGLRQIHVQAILAAAPQTEARQISASLGRDVRRTCLVKALARSLLLLFHHAEEVQGSSPHEIFPRLVLLRARLSPALPPPAPSLLFSSTARPLCRISA